MNLSNNIGSVKLIQLPTISNKDASLNFLEELNTIPYKIKRVFYVYGVTKGETRGNHAHKQCNQCLISMNGSIKVICDDGKSEVSYILDSPGKLLILPATIWSSQVYMEKSSILMVLTDQLFNEQDYIRNYDSYLKFRKAIS